eukprot:293012-Chlamydomonas_euryale.AAC.2
MVRGGEGGRQNQCSADERIFAARSICPAPRQVYHAQALPSAACPLPSALPRSPPLLLHHQPCRALRRSSSAVHTAAPSLPSARAAPSAAPPLPSAPALPLPLPRPAVDPPPPSPALVSPPH